MFRGGLRIYIGCGNDILLYSYIAKVNNVSLSGAETLYVHTLVRYFDVSLSVYLQFSLTVFISTKVINNNILLTV